MDCDDVKQLIKDKKWDLVSDTILLCNESEAFVYALKQEDCPAKIILDLWKALDPTVRLLVAKHNNTPMSIIKKMVESDTDSSVRKAAAIAYYNRRKSEY